MIIEVALLLGFLLHLGVVVLCWKRSRTRPHRRVKHRRDPLWPVLLAAAGTGMNARAVAGTGAAAGGQVSAPTRMPPVFAVTDARTGSAHLVTEDGMAAGRRAGHYPAVCGVEVLAASLPPPESGYCPSCAR
jgi:hypothetical protein